MKKFITYVLFIFVGFICFTSNVFATFTLELQSSSGKTATYKVTSSIKYSKEYISVTPISGISDAKITWNDDGLSGVLTVTFSSSDCTGDIDINYKADEGCDGKEAKNCEAILSDARSMIGKIPYEYGGKCASTSYEECQFNRIWTGKYPAIAHVTSTTPDQYPENLTRHGDGKGHTGLDCSGFVWWIFNRHGVLLTGQSGLVAATNAGVDKIKSSGQVYSITKDKAQPCDLVTSTKPDSAKPHIGIVSQVKGGMMFIHENSADDNVTENCYFDCQAPAQGKAVQYWRVKALWDGAGDDSSTCDGKETIHLDNSEHCACDTCDNIVIEPEHIEPLGSYYNNCCEDGDSHLKEYRISQLFCSYENKKLNIQYYDDQCNNDAYNDSTFDGLLSNNEFCRVYCTEEIDIQVPKHIESATGKFFKLAELAYKDLANADQTTKAPVIRGSKTCTIKVDYEYWRKNYVETVKQEVEQFNISQEKYALYEITKDPIITTEKITNTVNFKCVANTATKKVLNLGQGAEYLSENGIKSKCAGTVCEVDAYVAKDEEYMDSSGNTTKCDKVACLEYEYKTSNPSTTCDNTYKLYTVKTAGKDGVSCSGGKCSANYYQVKLEGTLDPDKGTVFDGIKVVNAGTKTATYDEKTAWPDSDGCTSHLDSFKNSQSGYTCEQVGGAKDIPDGITKAQMDKKAQEFEKAAKDAADQLSNKTVDAKTLEDAMDTCQNMFDKEDYAKEEEGIHETSKFYDLSPTVTFNYLQVYLNGDTKDKDWQHVNYSDRKCQYKFSNTVVDDIEADGNKEKVIYTSKKYGDGEEDMRDMKALNSNDKRVSNQNELNQLLDSANNTGKKNTKRFRRDAEYDALCTWTGEDIPKKMTLYPGPQVEDYSETYGDKMISEHKYQYALYITTYKAEYETYWELGGLGGSERTITKFMKYFNSDQAKTCANYNPEIKNKDGSSGGSRDAVAYSDGSDESPEAIIEKNNINADETSTTAFTCVMRVQYGGMRIGSCSVGVADIQSCTDNEIKEVFEFKVVDPKEMFPGDWTDKAQNWKKDDGSWGTTYGKIDSTAEVDNTYSPENLTYSYKLDTNTIKAIKNYNKDHPYSSYKNDKTAFSCTCPAQEYPDDKVDKYDCGTIDKPVNAECLTEIKGKTRWKYTCRECRSSFLEELSINHRVANGADYVNVGDTWNNKTAKFVDIRDNNNWA